jgi:hypothetical protein
VVRLMVYALPKMQNCFGPIEAGSRRFEPRPQI